MAARAARDRLLETELTALCPVVEAARPHILALPPALAVLVKHKLSYSQVDRGITWLIQ
jgi:hypothetical protein